MLLQADLQCSFSPKEAKPPGSIVWTQSGDQLITEPWSYRLLLGSWQKPPTSNNSGAANRMHTQPRLAQYGV